MEYSQNAKTVKRGEIYYIHKACNTEGSEQIAGRPGIIVSNDANNKHSETVEVVYCTSQEKKNIPTHTCIYSTGRQSTALCEQIMTISKSRIGDYLGVCTAAEMRSIDNCLRVSIGVEDGPMELTAIRVERDLYKKLYEDLIYPISKIASKD